MYLADSDLLMLENLTYINQDTRKLVKGLKDIRYYATIEEYLSVFDENALMTLEAQGNGIVSNGNCSGSELAAMIRYMKSKLMLKSLIIAEVPVNHNNHSMALCLEEPANSKNGIVVFQGTLDQDEWRDNALGVYQADTAAQIEALNYIESLPYHHLTVVGHSKGGNKAQYVSVLSHKVVRGVSFDSQGFSLEFIHKYTSLISRATRKLKSYSLSTDFVHPLLLPLPGITKLYVDGGEDVSELVQHHSPNAFFVYYEDSYNHTQIVCTSNGTPYFPLTEECSYVKHIHNYTTYIQQKASKADKKLIGDYVGDLLYIQFNRKQSEYERRKALLVRSMRNPKESATLLGYTARYIATYHLQRKDAAIILGALGIKDML